MILAYYGVERTEPELYACCETDADSTLPRSVVRCLQSLGFTVSAPRLLDLDVLRDQLTTKQTFPIVFLNLSPILGINVIHAVIVEVIDMSANQVQVIDPAYPPTGHRTLPLNLFEVGWRLVRGQAILVAPMT
jgi:ABC-type bacteriocin/lantibiotic exporter with double-glycine peptidase domain